MSDEINGELRPAGENPIVDAIREAIGAGPDEQIRVYSPPHKSRIDGREVTRFPLTEREFEELRHLSDEALRDLGLQRWDDSGLMLFPHEWFGLIPAGFPVTDIFGETRPWDSESMDDDCRFGALAYGIIPARGSVARG